MNHLSLTVYNRRSSDRWHLKKLKERLISVSLAAAFTVMSIILFNSCRNDMGGDMPVLKDSLYKQCE